MLLADIQSTRGNAWVGLLYINWRMDQTRHSVLSFQKLRFDLCSLLEVSKLRVNDAVSQRDQQHVLSTTTFQPIDSCNPAPCSTIIPEHNSRFRNFHMLTEWKAIRWHFATRYGLQCIIQLQTIEADWTRSIHWSCYEYFHYYFLLTNGIAHFCLLHWRVFATRSVLLVA